MDEREKKTAHADERRGRRMTWLPIMLSAISIVISSTAIVLALMRLVK